MSTHQQSPRVGVTSADDPTPDNYVRAVERSGGIATVLRNEPGREAADLIGLDALLVTGGTDISPERYRRVKHPQTNEPDVARDAYELELVALATRNDVPLLAICRGMQIANVAFGGTLHQHIPEIADGRVVHRDLERKFETFAEHIVSVESSSLLSRIVGSLRFETNASHHQAIDEVAAELRVVARTDDGIIEALERPSSSVFWLALQWHPERLLDADDGRSRRIFETFLDAARRNARLR